MSKKKIRGRSIALIVLAVLILLIGILLVWQRENLKALKDYFSYSQEELAQQLAENDQLIKDAVDTMPEVSIRDVTDEERESLKDGSMSPDELFDRLLESESESTVQDTNPGNTQQPDAEAEPTVPTVPDAEKSEYETQLTALIARVYVLREEYLILLDNLQDEATAAYKAMPSDQRTGAALADFVSSFLAKGTALEKECDRRMDAIVSELKSLIKANNGDMSIVDTVIKTYANEKSLKKAWYMSELEKKGLI